MTLVELVIAIVVIAIAVTAVLGLLSAVSVRSAGAMTSTQAAVDRQRVSRRGAVEGVRGHGRPGRARSIRRRARLQLCRQRRARREWQRIPGLGQYTVQIQAGLAALGAVPDAIRVDVTVTAPNGAVTRLTGFRTNYAGQVVRSMSARQGGFTLIELIVALMISVVVVGFVANFIAVPVQSHLAQARRSDLAASAEAVTHWMSQDVHGALPNSVRVGHGRRSTCCGDGRCALAVTIYGDTLNFGAPDDQFDVLGLPGAAATHVVIANLGTAAQNVYTPTNVIAPARVNVASSTITLAPPHQFVGQSPHRRAFLVSPATAVVRYECDLAARTLRRYDNLPVAAADRRTARRDAIAIDRTRRHCVHVHEATPATQTMAACSSFGSRSRVSRTVRRTLCAS